MPSPHPRRPSTASTRGCAAPRSCCSSATARPRWRRPARSRRSTSCSRASRTPRSSSPRTAAWGSATRRAAGSSSSAAASRSCGARTPAAPARGSRGTRCATRLDPHVASGSTVAPVDDTTYTVGALARASGLTVRTLHHWDAIGLLRPAERTAAGYRRYGPAEVARLYRVLALRRLGLSLEEIATALERQGPGLAAAVDAHLGRVERQLAETARLRDRLGRIRKGLAQAGEPSLEELVETIEVMTMHDRYYTPEQLAELERRSEALGPDGMERAQRDWAELIEAVEAERAAGTDPASPRVQALAERWHTLVKAFTGGDPAIAASLNRMYESEGTERASRGAMPAETMAYMGEAMRAAADT